MSKSTTNAENNAKKGVRFSMNENMDRGTSLGLARVVSLAGRHGRSFLDTPKEGPDRSSGLLGYQEVVNAFYHSSKFRALFERSDLPFMKTIFIQDGLPSTLINYPKKTTGRPALTLTRFSDTYAKLKIFISKNFDDLKHAFLFYTCANNIHHYQTYNEFIERICDSQQYKAGLRSVRAITLFEAANEDFLVRRVRRAQVNSRNGAALMERVNFYHKLAYYRHYKRLKVIDEDEAEEGLIGRLLAAGGADFEFYVYHRLWLLIQTGLGQRVEDFELALYFDGKSYGILSIDRVRVSPEPFVNCEDDEDNFEAIILPSVNLNSRSRFQKLRSRRSGLGDEDESEPPVRPEIAALFKPVQEKMQKQTNLLLTGVREDFAKTLASKFESDVCFKKLFPASRIPLSTLLKYEDRYHFLDEYVGKIRKNHSLI